VVGSIANCRKTTSSIKASVGTDDSVINPCGLSFTVGGIGYTIEEGEGESCEILYFMKMESAVFLTIDYQLSIN
jgi:hypothetical protein